MKHLALILLTLVVQACGNSYRPSQNLSSYNGTFYATVKCSRSVPPAVAAPSSDAKADCKTPSVEPSAALVSDKQDRFLVSIPLKRSSGAESYQVSRLAYANLKTQKLLEFKCTRESDTTLSCVPSCEQDLESAKDAPPTPCTPVPTAKLVPSAEERGAWSFRLLTIKTACGSSNTYQAADTDDDTCSEAVSARRIGTARFPNLDLVTGP